MKLWGLLFLSLLILSCSESGITGTTDETELEIALLEGELHYLDGNSVANASISLFKDSSTQAYRTTSSNVFGYYNFDSLTSGTYRISALAGNDTDTLSFSSAEFFLKDTVSRIDTLKKGGYITGQVIFQDSTPASAIICYIPGTSWMAVSDNSGNFKISNIPEGVHSLKFLSTAIQDTTIEDISVISNEITALQTIFLKPKLDLVLRDVYGAFSKNAASIQSLTITFQGDSISDEESLPRDLNWNSLSQGFSGYVPLPSKGLEWTITISVYDTLSRLIGMYSQEITKETGDILIPEFDPLNATPQLTLDSIKTVAQGELVSFSGEAIDNFGGTCTWFAWDFNGDTVIDDSSEVNKVFYWQYAQQGAYTAYFYVKDNHGNISSDSLMVNVPDIAPAIEFISPSTDTLIWSTGLSLDVTIAASDSYGGVIIKRELDVDGDGIFESQWQQEVPLTVNLAYGNHLLVARCTDNDNNSSYDTLQIVLESIHSIAANESHSFYISHDKTLWAAGNNYDGKLGNGDNYTIKSFSPILSDVKSVSTGRWHTSIIKNDNSLWMCGSNGKGQLGIGTMGYENEEMSPIFVMNNISKCAPGDDYTMILDTNGILYATGRNDIHGVFGIDTISGSTLPTQIQTGVIDVASGLSHVLRVDSDGTLWGIGDNSTGQLGNGESGYKVISHEWIEILPNIKKVFTGWNFSMAIDNEDNLWAWGSNRMGQLGVGSSGNDNLLLTPTKVLSNVKTVSCGSDFSLVLTNDNSLWVTGNNGYGQLGTGDYADRVSFVKVLDSISHVSTGEFHSIIINQEGAILGSGNNSDNALGDKDSNSSNTFKELL